MKYGSKFDSYAPSALKYINRYDEVVDVTEIISRDLKAIVNVNQMEHDIIGGNGYTFDYDCVVQMGNEKLIGIQTPELNQDNPKFTLWLPDLITSSNRVKYELYKRSDWGGSGEPVNGVNLNDCLLTDKPSETLIFPDITDPRLDRRISTFIVHGVYGAGFNATNTNTKFRVLRPRERYILRIENMSQAEALVGINSCFYEVELKDLGNYIW